MQLIYSERSITILHRKKYLYCNGRHLPTFAWFKMQYSTIACNNAFPCCTDNIIWFSKQQKQLFHSSPSNTIFSMYCNLTDGCNNTALCKLQLFDLPFPTAATHYTSNCCCSVPTSCCCSSSLSCHLSVSALSLLQVLTTELRLLHLLCANHQLSCHLAVLKLTSRLVLFHHHGLL